MKSALLGILVLLAFVALAPAAKADSGTLLIDGNNFTLNSFTLSSNELDTSLNAGPIADLFFFADELTGAQLGQVQLMANGNTYNLNGAYVSSFGLGYGPSGIVSDVDFVFLNSSNVPEPATFGLLACGLAGLAFISRRKPLLS